MCNNVISLILLILLLTKSSDTFRLFSSDTGTYKEPRPFFTSSKKLIDDYYDGNLAQVSKTINSHTFVFVMYYANFCGISRRMRDPYEKAAAFYRERIHHENNTLDKFHVKFIAVDCFYYDGQCRKTYKLNYFPHMFLYVKGTRGYQYFGATIATNLIEFIEKIRMPVIRLTNINEFLDFTVQYESNILAYFDFSNDLQRYHYSLYAQAALKHIEYDNEYPTRFALILNQSIVAEISKLYNNNFQKPFVILHRLGSEPQTFPNMTNNFTMENLFQWVIIEHKKPHVSWIVPKNSYYSHSPSIDKEIILDALTDHHNLLLFFTSNKLDELKLRQIYLYLSNCNITYSSLWLKQIENLYNHSLINLTENLPKTQRHLLSSCCQYALNQLSTTDIYNLCVLNHQISSFNLSKKHTKVCLPILENVTLQKICFQTYCHQWLKNSTLVYPEKLTYNHEIVLEKRREKFYDQFINNQQSKIINDDNSLEKYKGFLCQMNSTWAFRLINSRDYPNFGQNIGLINHSRAIVVLQPKNEQHYILNNNEITTENIYKFIYDISYNVRPRSYTTIPNNKTLIKHSNKLIELTTDTFYSIVFNPDKHVVVVYYTKWCGFCQSIWPVLYQTKKFFNNFNDLIFTRIQADKHDLPWHLTAYNYPTLILFPAQRKNHSIVFPTSTESMTNVNLIKFLLYHLYIDENVNEQWCKQTNNSFLSMLSSTFIDFSQLSYVVKSFS
ncbi:unnamed protein product [Adineta steineri]|uniref:Thioredoxin domain-containing protein n=1 Tax=Adineta steineri TaxID=433720 RepID=A0A814Y843_9BILA|nr:unnamed protein product [Adineta steineri]CAF3649667.1 unnamed protein product [Adineta steineri]